MSIEPGSVWRHKLYDHVFVVTRCSAIGSRGELLLWWQPLDDPQGGARWVNNPLWEASFDMFAERIA